MSSAYIRLGGGIDLVTPPEQLPPGAAIYAVNYECPVTGGYRRIDGYAQQGPVVPGEGPLLGVVTFTDDTYAVRKDVGDDSATLYVLNTGTNTWDAVGTAGTLHNGRHEFVEGNFLATSAGRALYMVGGGKPFELKDGTLTQLANGPSGAKHIAIHANHLFLGFEPGSLQHSDLGDPDGWDAATGGAGEIAVGQTLTGLVPGTGGTLHVICRDSVKTLYGTSAADWQLKTTVVNSGGRPYSAQSLVQPYFIAERGIASLVATQEYGDFRPMQPGAKIEPIFTEDGYANRVVASAISKAKAQYRVFFDDGSGVYISPAGITTVRFPLTVAVAHSGELSSGAEQLLIGDDTGHVYRLDDGATSFAGEPIEAFLTLAYTDLKSPSARKRFRRAFWDIRSGTDAQIAVLPDFDYGRIETARPRRFFIDFMLGGGLWDVADWGAFNWSVPSLAQEAMDITGTGTSINFAIYSGSVSAPHELLGYDIVYDVRRQRRG
ncbi:hypothetical protein [Bisbaumannia pacifica]|uniref:Uncharacterized protein n=1 Tax=Bisbaumannia pacifica TaxID=77098 RepID=A0ABD4KZQ3_9GAMM|nr:hypothetical protein [Halomonas pacifica]MBH8578793.1 hypothetical protein [Halomonas pacifica]